MRKTTKIWLIVATFLVVLGLALFAAVMFAYDWDFTKLSTGKYEENTYEISEAFGGISINTDTADIIFMPADDGKARVECVEEEKAKHSVAVQEGVLTINLVEEKSWYDYIGIYFRSPKITVYLPEREYAALFIEEDTGDIEIPKEFAFGSMNVSLSTGDVCFSASVLEDMQIETSTGNICVENTTAGNLDLSTSTGKIEVSNVVCRGDVSVNVTTGKINLTGLACTNLTSEGDTGDILLEEVMVTEKISIYTDTGDVRFDRSDAAEIFVETDTGDVLGSLLTGKIFIVQTDTGKVDVPRTVTGGKCEITTDTGNIRLKVN